MLLILDLDETLVYSIEQPLDREPDFVAGPYSVYQRPSVHAFIDEVAAVFRLAVWTSSSTSYAGTIAARLFASQHLELFWSREQCTQRHDPETREHHWIKDLRKVKRKGYDLARVLMVDDSPEKMVRNYGNHIRVAPFFGDPADDELPRLAEYLASLASCPNVRCVDKRGWRRQCG